MLEKMITKLQKTLDEVKEAKEIGMGEEFWTQKFLAEKEFVEEVTGMTVSTKGWKVELI